MAIDVHVTIPPEVTDPYYAFKSAAAQELLALFKAGAKLCVWRCSSPWNYYLETADGEQHYFEGAWLHLGHMRALKALGTSAGRSKEVITRSLSRCEIGMPQKEWWLFDAEKAKKLEEQWAHCSAACAEHEARATPLRPRLEQLTAYALSLLRTLRNGDTPRAPELENEFQELDRQGLLRMRRNGRYYLAPAARSLRIPRGQSLKLRGIASAAHP
jgi:hypothetical protein